MDDELERELAAEQEEEEEQLCLQMAFDEDAIHRPLAKVFSLPANFTFSNDSSNGSLSIINFNSLSYLKLITVIHI